MGAFCLCGRVRMLCQLSLSCARVSGLYLSPSASGLVLGTGFMFDGTVGVNATCVTTYIPFLPASPPLPFPPFNHPT